jgi:peptidoglycan hydrolase-like protein with peptidoglycan-binding domain
MPDVYLTTAVDWDQDGHRDIWTNRGDVAASIGNYLQDRGWRRGEPVFDEVRLPDGFDYSLADGTQRSIADWNQRGVHKVDGTEWDGATWGLQSQLFLPAGANGPALMLHPNFSVIRRYNNSDRYALVVALLARAFDGRSSALVRDWPRAAGSLNREEILELQTLLNGLGYTSGNPDGLFGSATRGAVRSYQAAQSLPADGFPTSALLNRVRQSAGVSAEPARVPVGLGRTGIRSLQRLLNRLGYDAGRADGMIGARTRDAIRKFERAQGMEVRGRATDVVLEAARAAAG